jgi:hypothetical protein
MIVLKKRRTIEDSIITTRGKCVGIAETLSGTLDNYNQIYYTTNDYESGSITVMWNGQSLHSPYDFIESDSNEITFTEIAPYPGDKLRANYEYDTCTGADESGKVTLVYGISSKYVAFSNPFPDANYVVFPSISNVIDVYPSIYPYIVSSKTINGFTVDFSGNIDSNNYVLEWTATGL